MDKVTLYEETWKNFANNAKPGSYLMLVRDKAGDYFAGQEFADNCGPGTNRKLVGVKREDGTIKYYGRFKCYDHKTNN